MTSEGKRVGRWRPCVLAVYWALLFGVFPLAMNYVSALRGSVSHISADEIVTVPKIVVLAICWVGGVLLALVLNPGVHFTSLPRLFRSKAWWGWSLAFLVGWIILAAVFSHDPAASPWLGSQLRYDGVVFQVMWWSLIWITWSIARATAAYSRALVYVPALAAGAVIAVWTTLEAYGFEPLSLLSKSISSTTNGNAAASLGHQGLVSIYLSSMALALTVYVTRGWADVRRTRPTRAAATGTMVLIGVLWMGAYASGGRSGAYAALAVWLVFVASGIWKTSPRRVPPQRLLGITALLVVLAIGIGLTSKHVQAKTESTITGGASFAHRLITWQVGARAIAARPIVGYGPDAFSTEIWKFSSKPQARELLTEYVPRKYLASARRVGDAVAFIGAGQEVHSFRFLYDKTHNYLIELAFASGLPALAALLALIAFAAWRLARARDRMLTALLWGFVVAFIAVQAWFYTIDVDPIIWAWLGVALGWAAAKGTPVRADTTNTASAES